MASFALPVIPNDEELAGDGLGALLNGIPVAITGWGDNWKNPVKLPPTSLAPEGSVVFVSHAAGSVNPFGVVAALEAGHIKVSHAAPVIAEAVAEFTLAQMLAHFRHHRELDDGFRTGVPWHDLRNGNLGQLLSAQKVGIVGLGYIGCIVAKLLRSFGCKVFAYDPFISRTEADGLGVALISLDSLFNRCTAVSLHAANLPATKGMITRRHLAALLPGSLLVNTARAGLVETGALLEVLKHGRIFAALDTFEIEPLPEDDALRKMRNVYLSPKSGGHTSDSYIRQGFSAIEEVRRFFAGEKLQQEIKREKASVLA